MHPALPSLLALSLLAACSDSAAPLDGARPARDAGPASERPAVDAAGCEPVASDRCSFAEPGPCRLALGSGVVGTLEARTCAGAPCVRILAPKAPLDRELTVTPPAGRTVTALLEARAIGSHAGGSLTELALELSLDDGSIGVAVIDPESGTTLALTRGPAGKGKDAVLLGYQAGSDGRRYPYLTSGAAEHWSGAPAAESWGAYLCIYRPGLSDAPCGKSFARWDTRPTSAPFLGGYARTAGGLSADADGDGWEEIQLPLFGGLLVLSGITGKQLAATSYDVAATTPAYSGLPAGFHGGRQDGVLSARASAGLARVLVIGGSPAGLLGGDATVSTCNASRFVALLENNPKSPGSRKLKWARYYSFHQPVFDPHDPLFSANNPELVPARLKEADLVDRCVQIPGDGRAHAGDGTELVLINVFQRDPSGAMDTCTSELWRLRCTGFTGQKEWDAYNACLVKAQKTKGSWRTETLGEADGAAALTLGFYTWGVVERILPGQGSVLIGEQLVGTQTFDLAAAGPSRMLVLAIKREPTGSFAKLALGELPLSGRPRLRYVAPPRDSIAATAGPIAELVTADLDCDGLLELQLANGCWIGYSAAKGALVGKAGCP